MESWTVQLFTLLGVAIGAFASFISTRFIDRSRWRREEALRWDSKRLEYYIDFATTIIRYISLGYGMTAEYSSKTHVQALDVSAADLARAEAELTEKLEQVRMLGSPTVIAACQKWRREAIRLDAFARGILSDPREYEQATQDRRAAQRRFYRAVRDDLGVASAEPGSPDPTDFAIAEVQPFDP